ncbi:hypothetical protein LR48_Vigan03g083300 [Vigna angularis]|uniref:Transposase MuDR plant domain-containing protein n=1 Tax=Phaseolus angularis TaxID=3914 RepID=A0A0L9U3W0_PHAAN|nr:hypothetical protein LR48_Vigan03g083300 [Vigna angularis]
MQGENIVEHNVGVEEEEVVIEQHGQGEEEVVIEEFSSSEDDDAGVVHGEVPHEVVDEEEVDEGQVDEGLVDVDVNIDEGLVHNNIEGSVLVEVSENEMNCDLDTHDSAHRQRNPNDKGLSDDEWDLELLDSPEESGSEDGVDERQSCGPFGTYVKQKNMSEYKWEVGTKFSDKNEFMEAVRSYVVHAGRNLKFVKNDNRRGLLPALSEWDRAQILHELRKDETQMTKGGHRKKCSIFRLVGHNRNQCPLLPQDQPDLPQPSEVAPPQPTQESTEQPTQPIRRDKLPIRRPSLL